MTDDVQGGSRPGTAPGGPPWGGAELGPAPYGVPGAYDLDAAPDAPPPRRRRRGAVVAAVVASAVAVAAVAAGGFVVWGAVGGGGDQPEAHLPASAIAFAKVDLDPSVGQKIGAIRFARAFPGGRDLREDGDPRQWVWERLTKGVEQAPPWSDVQRWLGKRAAVAVVPAGGGAEPIRVLVLEVGDEAAARADLDPMPGSDVVTGDGWAYLAPTRAQAQAALDGARAGSLEEQPTFAADLDRLGEDGVATAWVDSDGVVEALGAQTPQLLGVGALEQASGRAAFALRFDGDDLELAGHAVTDEAMPPPGEGADVGSLPDSTVAAVGLTGLAGLMEERWAELAAAPAVDTVVATIEDEVGLALPDDLDALLGTRFTMAVGAPAADGVPALGAVVQTPADPAPVLAAFDRLAASSGAPVVAERTGTGWVAATDAGWARTLGGGGTLGASPRFARAVPDAADAGVVGYVDIEAVLRDYPDLVGADRRADVEPLSAVGWTAVYADGGEVTFRLRVLTR